MMKKMRWCLLPALAFLLFATGNSALAQSSELAMEIFSSNTLSTTNMLIGNAAVESAMRNARGEKISSASAKRKINLSYTPTKALQQQTVKNLSAQVKSRNPAAAQSINTVFGTGKADYSQIFSQLIQTSGLPANNAATALAAYIEMGYIVVNNVRDAGRITPAMDRALQRQTTYILNQNSKLASPATLAKLGEELKLQAVVLYLGWQQVLKSGQTGQFRTGIAQQFKSKGLDLSKLKLTTRGLQK